MRSVYFCFLLSGLACGTSPDNTTTGAVLPGSAPAAPPAASVVIIHDGHTIASYESRRPDAILDSEILKIELNSPDTKYSFMGFIGGTRSGRYALHTQQQPGRATISVYNDGSDMPSALTPTEGQVSLTGMNGKSCSGSFSGSLKDQNGKAYIIKGTFSNIPVRNIEAGK